ncbi:MAG: ABC transporter permease [Chloroflexi bacterium]|nr:ABC transporter permease [Chloroflexota bacterium]MCI0575076.1 ABC transporter permease [Chloroflexota bacterium]MCI0643602.1 ABC transporter permease [Chloroflexota bacterium]MCI0726224.1 ABC transporter permease [Chloroflexota bacterium]
MTELASPRPKPFILNKLLQNPVTVKELRSRMRGRRAFVVLTLYLLLMSGFISLIYLAYAASANSPYGPDSRQAGKVVFAAVLGVQAFLVTFIGPAFTMAAISGERERQTYDLLRTTLLSANSLVVGKLLSALSYVFLLIFASVPLQSIAFLLGGVSLVELVLSQLLVAVSAVTFALVGLFFSSVMRTTLASSVMTFATALFLTAGVPLLAIIFGSFLGIFFSGLTSPSWIAQVILIYIGLALAATNFPITLIVSEVFLLEEGALFYYSQVIDGHTVYILSPWYGYLFLYVLLSLFLYWACVRRVRRIPNK